MSHCVTAGYAPGILGFEVDFGWSPNFFQPAGLDDDIDFGDSSLMTLMANVLVTMPSGFGVRPYGSGGIGWIRANIGDELLPTNLKQDDVGFNVGAGVYGMFTDAAGIRGDIRYFRSFEGDNLESALGLRIGTIEYWRATVGFRFGW